MRNTSWDKCKGKELKVLIVADETIDKASNNGEEETKECKVEEVEDSSAEVDMAELSLNMVVGFSSPGTLKVKGKIEDREVVVLIDCGATHNFISQKLVEEMKLPISETLNYGIQINIGTWTAVKGKGICTGIVISMDEITVAKDFLPIELGGIDVILDMQWLRTLGVTTVDWKTLTMTIDAGDTKITIEGDPSLTKTEVSLKQLKRTWGKHDQGFLVELKAITAVVGEPAVLDGRRTDDGSTSRTV